MDIHGIRPLSYQSWEISCLWSLCSYSWVRSPITFAVIPWLFARTRSRYIQKHESFGLIALTLFVAVPFPLTGAWTGCAIAFLLGFRFLPALGAVATGVLIAAGIVTATVMGVKILIF